MVRGALALSGVAVSLAVGCQQPQAFQCEVAADCIASGADGVCEANGFCSFPDMRCPSGRAFGEFAAQSLAGECVEPDSPQAADTEGAGDDTAYLTTGVSESASTTMSHPEDDETTGDSSSSTGSPLDEDESSSSGDSGDETTAVSACDDWWDEAWRRRVAISYPAGATTESLLEFPLFLELNPSRVDYDYLGNEGVGIRVVDPETFEVIPHVVHEWDAHGITPVWVRVPELDPNGGVLHIYYDNGNADDVNDEYGVFFGAYEGISHNDLDAELLYPTGNELCTSGETEPGFVGHASSEGAFCFQSSAEGTPLSLEQRGTASLWVKRENVLASNQGLAQYGLGGQAGPLRWVLKLHEGTEPELQFLHLGLSQQAKWSAVLPTWHAQDWHQIAVTNIGEDDVAIYFDGEPVDAELLLPSGGLSTIDSPAPFSLGNAGDADPLEGVVDEFRYSAAPRSASWIAAEYASDTGNLLTWGAEELLPDCSIAG